MIRSHSSRFVAGATLVVLSLLAASCSSSETSSAPSTVAPTTIPEPTEFTGYVRSPALDVSSVTLPTVDGTPVDMVADPNELLIVYFGFASCPDVCPMTLTSLKKAVANQSEADQKRLQVAVITIDPTRDTADKFDKYVKQYFPTGHAIRTDDPTLLRSSGNTFGAEYRIKMNKQGEREVTHSDDLYVVDDTGTVVLAWPFGATPQDLTADLRRLLAGDRPGAEGEEQ